MNPIYIRWHINNFPVNRGKSISFATNERVWDDIVSLGGFGRLLASDRFFFSLHVSSTYYQCKFDQSSLLWRFLFLRFCCVFLRMGEYNFLWVVNKMEQFRLLVLEGKYFYVVTETLQKYSQRNYLHFI